MPRASAIKQSIVSQFGCPRGPIGLVAGWVMANRPSNRERNLQTVEFLDIRPSDQVLEIGYGPGVAVERVSTRLERGRIVGVDHSELMHGRASRRNAAGIRRGRVDLRVGTVEDLVGKGLAFDKVFAVNVHMFWRDPRATLRTILELLRPGGLLALTTQPRRLHATDTDSRSVGERMALDLQSAGFSAVRVELIEMKPVSAACALGRRPLPS